jgi:hypothetical protein
MHTINDKIKLTGPTNEIKYGYLLFFVRDNREYYRNEKVIRHNLEDAAKRIRVVIAIVDKENKPKPEVLGKWKEV